MSKIGTQLTLVMLVLLGFMGATFAIYFKYTSARIEELVDDKAKIEMSLANVKNNYKTLKEQVEEVNENILVLEKNRNDIYNNNKKEKIIFDDHDLGKLTKKKPKLMESKINKAIEQRFEDFENL